MNEPTAAAMGFGNFIAQSDLVGKSLLVLLLAMSAASWAIIVVKGVLHALRKRRSHGFLALFWNATTLDEVRAEIATHGAREPYAHLSAHALNAKEHYARHGARKLADAGSEEVFLTRTIKKVLDEETRSLENGLTMMATVGATAPFVGLLGTVWGIMNSFIGISNAHTTNLAVVAPGIAEALLATALGLFAAIPAVIAYNRYATELDRLANRFESFMEEFSNILQRQTR